MRHRLTSLTKRATTALCTAAVSVLPRVAHPRAGAAEFVARGLRRMTRWPRQTPTIAQTRRPVLASVAAAAMLLLHPLVPQAAVAAQDAGIAVGTAAPGAGLETLDGRPIDLKQFIGTKPVLFEFWATWCPNCKELEPSLIAATKKYGTQMRFVTVAVSANQTAARVAAWHKANPIATEMLYDRKGLATDAYDVPATSYVVIVNKAGKVVYTGVGGKQDLDGAIRRALN